MISKADILERAREWQLTPEVVEKDYVLGWLLAGVAQHTATMTSWVFKGGTCLKKCVMETYRFSEDLDFTLVPGAEYTVSGLETILKQITSRVTELSGIQFPTNGISIKPRQNLNGQPTYEGRIQYSGPLAFPGSPKIRLDLTQHEPVLRPVERRRVFHPYPDQLPAELLVTTYAVGELVAEKTRALCERTRPRDLYDVVLLSASQVTGGRDLELRETAREKFAVKGMLLPSIADVVRLATDDAELRSEWSNMLGHQLPATPLLDDYLARLPEAIAWLQQPAETAPLGRPAVVGAPPRPRPALRSVEGRPGDQLVAESGIRTWGVAAPIETVRFAGANHLLVEILYNGARRIVEPYSLRRPKTGNLLLYGFEQLKNGVSTDDIRAYKIDEIQEVRVLQQSFVPRYAIELTER
ncbi:MAG: nucleotidyl transferase AbiEii/AbiGii toxin family protein, partial [Gemmatimonadaceae bacterium]